MEGDERGRRTPTSAAAASACSASVDRAGTALSQRDVAERVGIDPSDVVDLVDRLEAAGFVRRRRDDRDRRRYALELTGAGHDAIERFHAVARAVDDVVFDVLDPAERDQLRALLERVGGRYRRPWVGSSP